MDEKIILRAVRNASMVTDIERALFYLDAEYLRKMIAMSENVPVPDPLPGFVAHNVKMLKLILFLHDQYREMGLHDEARAFVDSEAQGDMSFVVPLE